MATLIRVPLETLSPGTRFSAHPEGWHACPCYVIAPGDRFLSPRHRKSGNVFYLYARDGSIGWDVGSHLVYIGCPDEHPTDYRVPTAQECADGVKKRAQELVPGSLVTV